MKATREWLCLLGAGVIHLAVPVAAAIAPGALWGRQVEPAVVEKPQEIEIEFSADSAILPEPLRDARDVETMPTAADERPPASGATRRTKPDEADPTTAVAAPDDEPVAITDGADLLTAEPDAGLPDEYYRPPSAGQVWPVGPGQGLTPGGPRAWQLPGAIASGSRAKAAPTQTPRRRHDPNVGSKIVADGMRKKSAKLGLDFPGRGPIRSAFVSAAWSSTAPPDSSASFVVAVSGAGKVTTVSFTGSYSGGTAAVWRKVATRAKAQLAGASLVMKGSYRSGATVSVFLRSKVRAAGGGTRRDGATIGFDVTDAVARAKRIITASVAPHPL